MASRYDTDIEIKYAGKSAVVYSFKKLLHFLLIIFFLQAVNSSLTVAQQPIAHPSVKSNSFSNNTTLKKNGLANKLTQNPNSLKAVTYNYNSFSNKKYYSAKEKLSLITPAEYQQNPDFGIAPNDSIQWMELIHKRTETTRTYIDAKGDSIYEYSYSHLNYKDKNGWWRALNAKLSPANGGWAALAQPYPTYLLPDASSAVSAGDNEKIIFNKNVTINGKPINTLGNTVGNDGMYINSVKNGISKNIIFREDEIESDYVIKNSAAAGNGDMVIEEEVELPAGFSIEKNLQRGRAADDGSWVGELLVLNAEGVAKATFRTPVFYDSNPDTSRETRKNSFRVGSYKLVKRNGKHFVQVIVPSAWLHDTKRIFPVTIDPIVTGPTTTWAGGTIPSCFSPANSTAGITITIPAGITITSFLVTDSYYADAFDFAEKQDGDLWFTTSCGRDPSTAGTYYTIQNPTPGWNVGGYAFLLNQEMKQTLTCCYAPSCSVQTFTLTQNLMRTFDFFSDNACDAFAVYYNTATSYPFSAYIIGRTVEGTWSVPGTTICSNNCNLTLSCTGSYGVPPYTVTHPWAAGSSTFGSYNSGGNPCTSAGNTTLSLTIPGCPSTCGASTLSVPAPTITDACGNTVSGLVAQTIPLNPIPVITPSVASVNACSGGTFAINFNSCVGGTISNWTCSDGTSGTGNISTSKINASCTPLALTYTITPSNGTCSGSPITVPVTVYANPTSPFTVSPSPVCINAPVTVTYTGISCAGATYTWDFAGGTVVSGSGAGPYQVKWGTSGAKSVTLLVSQNGCSSSTTTVGVTVNPLPTISVSPASPSFCVGSAGPSLTASGASTYTWSPGTGLSATTGATVTANPAGTTTYTITGTNASGCSATTTVVVTVNPKPTVTVSPGAFCQGGPGVSITASGANTYTWSPPTGLSSNTGATVTAHPIATTTYTVTGTSAAGCTKTATVVVTVNPNPVLSSNPRLVCSGAPVNLTVTGADSLYTWTPATGLDFTTGSSVNATLTVTTTYTIVGTNTTGCTGTTTVAVTMDQTDPIVVPAAALCQGGAAQPLTATSTTGYTYQWSPATGLNKTTGASVNANPTITTTYTVTGTTTDGFGCTNSTTVVVTVNPPPVVTVPVAASCGGAGATLTASGADTYTWAPGATLSATTGTSVTANPTVTTTYTITGTITATGCTGNTTVVVTIYPKPVVNATPVDATCGQINGAVNINVIGGTSPFTYSWSNTATTQNISSLPAATYTVTVTDSHGCTATATATVGQHPSPTASATPTDATCGNSNGSVSLIVTNGTSPFTYLWSNTKTTQNISGLAAASYSVTVTDVNGCTATATATVGQHNPPTATATPTDATCGNSNGSVSLIVTNGTSPFTYLWSNTKTTQNISGLAAASYSVTVTDANGCTATASAIVGQHNPPTATATPTDATCGNNNGSVSLVVTNGTSPFTYLWSNTATTQNISALPPASYSVTVTDANGCTATATAIVGQHNPPTATATPTDATCGNSNGSVSLIVTNGTSPFTYSWSNTATTQNISALPPASYSVTVTDANGCTAMASATVGQHNPPSATATPTGATCGTSNGSVSLNVTNGTSPFTYLWSNTATTQNISGLPAASYSVTVTDAYGCTTTATATVGNTNGPTANATPTDATCGNSNGSISLIVTGSTGPYSYVWSNAKTTQNISSLPAAAYTVTITDANGCTATASATVGQHNPPTATATPTDATCGNSNGSVSLIATNGTSPFTYLWSNTATTQNLSNLPPASYTVTVTDLNGCTATATATVGQHNPPTATATPIDATCGNSNGSVSLNVTNGTSPFAYLWSNTATTQNLSNLPPASYTVTVTDANGCTSTTSATVGQHNPPTATATPTDATCGNSNGSVSLNVTNGTSPFTYLWSNTATTQNISVLPSASYSVTVTDANGCTAAASATVGQHNPPTATATPTDATCGNNNGSVSLNVTNGTSPVTYLWSNTATTQNISNLPAASYTVTVTDVNGCTATATATVGQHNPPTATATPTDATCGNNNGSVSLNVTNGTSPFTYLWSNTATTQNLNNLAPTSYSVTVADANGCTATASAIVGQHNPPIATATPTDATCGNNNGSVSLNVTNGTSPFTYLWSNAKTTQNISGLAAASYSVTVTDVNGCTATATATVGQHNPPIATATPTDATCGNNNGSVSLVVTNGTSPFTYLWSNAKTTQNISNLPAASYSVTVTDANGCTATASATVGQHNPPTATATPTDATCGNSNGSVSLIVMNGTSPFTYLWSNTATTQNISNLPAASYSVTVTDANGCTATASATVGQYNPPTATATPTDATCGNNNGSVSLNVTNGTSPFTYLWSNTETTQNLNNLAPTSYSVTVTDANGCTATASAIVGQHNPPIATATPTDATCGNSNGSVSLIVTNGTSPFTYLWSNTATTQNISNLPAASYSVTVTDANGCTATGTATVGNTNGPTANATPTDATCGNSNGSINLTVIGSTGPYTYLWSNTATAQNISNLSATSYTVTITDANGCTATASAIVGQHNPPTAIATPTDATCGNSNGSVVLVVTNGTAPFTYLWSNAATTQNLSSLPSSSYSVTITDANGCTATASAIVGQHNPPTASATPTDATCGNSNGSVSLNVTNGTPSFTYLWSNTATTQNISNLSPASYTVTVTDVNSCTATATATVGQHNPPTATATPTDATCGNSNGSVSLIVTNGTSPFAYLWSNTATTQNISNLSAAPYSVTVTDANGCTATTTAIVGQHNPPTATATPTDATCSNNNGSVSLIVTNGTSPFTYLWSNTATTQNISNLSAASYSVTVTDANGCTATASAIVGQHNPPTAIATPTDATCGNNNGSVVLVVTNGTAPFTYLWSNTATTQNMSNLPSSSYSVTITDANGCTATASAIVGQHNPPAASATPTDATCGNSNGSVSLNVTNGTSPFTYLWSNTATTQNISSLSAASYSVTVTDANGCTATATATVGQHNPPTATATPTGATCANSNGSVNLNVTNGTSPFTYLWSNTTTTQNISGLPAATYSVTVSDANGCTTIANATVGNTNGPTANATPTDATCGNNNGSINLTVIGNTGPYTFVWSNTATTQNISSLPSASYTVTVTDANGCTAAASATVGQHNSPTATATPTDATCGNSNGNVSLNVTNGTSPFTYLWSNTATTQNISNLSAASYSVTVTDANGCTVTATAIVGQHNPPTATATPTDATCGQSNGSVTLVVTNGTSTFTYLWSNTATTQNLPAVPAAAYSVTVTDANGCSAIVGATVNNIGGPSAVATPTDASCGQSNGSVSLVVTNGTSPFTYSWSNTATTQNIPAVPANTYSVTVTDANGCSAIASTTVNNIGGPSAVATPTDASCGQSNGSVTLVVTNGTSTFTYLWSNTATTQNLPAVPAAAYSVTVTDANGCSAIASATVNNIGGPSAVATPTDAACGQSNGSVSLIVTNGTSPYTYTWSNTATTQNITSVPAAAYSVTVTDANGCSAIASTTVNNIGGPSAVATPTDASCGQSNGSVSLVVTNGTSPFTYSWSNTATTQNLPAVSANSYSVTVTDANGCSAIAGATVNNIGGPSAIATPTDASCGQSNGSVSLVVTNGTSPFTYSWSNTATTQNIPAVPANTYSVTVTDANGCSAIASTTVNNIGGPSAVATPTDASCGQSNGSVTLAVTNGTSPFTYLWSNTATTQNLPAVPANSYSVTVTDANGCSAIASTTVNNIGGPSAVATPTDAACGQSNGSVSLVVTGGTSPFTYSWSNTATTQNLPAVPANSYSVTVTDANGCSAIANATVGNAGGPSAVATPTDASCGQSNGSVTLAVTNGTSPFTYLWSNTATTQNLPAVPAAAYSVTVTDANGCSAIVGATVNNIGGPSAVATPTDASCGQSNGSVSLVVTNGTSPFTYSWSNTATTQNIPAVPANTYSVTVTDANGCSAIASTTVNNIGGPSAVATPTDASCGQSNGSVTLAVTNGTSPFTYLWSNNATTQNLPAVSANSYSVTVTDANGCSAIAGATVNNIGGPSAIATPTDANCGQSNGSVTLAVTNGTSPFTYLWSNTATTQNLPAVPAAAYSVTVTDANGCSAIASATVNNIGGPSAVATPTDASCGQSNGSVSLVVTNGTSPFTYSWSNTATTQNLPAVPAAAYSVTVTDANGCSAIAGATVNNIGGPSAVATPTDAACGQSNGSVSLVVTNGTSPYTYTWSNTATTQNITSVPAAAYSVTVTDANGCSAIASTTVNNIGGPSAVATPTDASCGQSNGSVTLVVTGGTSPFTYLWSNTATTQNIPAVPATAYSVTVTDANGCSAIASATVNNIGGPSAVATPTDAACGQSNGSVSLVVTNGTSPYTYTWSNTATTQNITSVPAAAYSVTVTDANGCSAIASTTVNNIGGPSAVATPTDASCGQSNGSVSLVVTNGTSPYTYTWSNTATTQNITSVPAAAYSVTVTDANGCSAITSGTVNNIGGPSAVATPTDASCGQSNGSVSLVVTNGTSPFTYSWSNTATTQNLPAVPAAAYSVTVTDANGCSVIAGATVNNIGGPTAVATPTDASCGQSNGSVTLVVTNGTSPFTYLWSNNATTQNIPAVTPNSYTVTVTDANGCSVIAGATVNNIGGPSAIATPTDASCGQSNGSVTLAVTNGTSPFTYSWSNVATTQDIAAVPAAAYSVTVTDANGCSAIASTTVNNIGGPSAVATPTDASCGQSNGSVTLAVTNGTSPFTYSWSNTATTQNLPAVPAAAYSVTVTDANGCSVIAGATVNNIGGPTAVATPTDASCGQSNGSVTLAVTNGTSPFTYSWSNTATTQNLPAVPANSYSVTVTDANGCSAIAGATVNDIAGPTATATATDASCGQNNGAVNLGFINGIAPFTYLWSNTASTKNITSIPAANYIVTVTDANGCTVTTNATVNDIGGPSAVATPTDASCGQSNGSVTLAVTNGTSPFTYLWSNNATTQNLPAVPANSYSVTVTDANGCSAIANATVGNTGGPSAVATPTDASCGQSNGSVTLAVTNGTSPFTYLWSNNATTQNLPAVPANSYSVTVTDANGCSAIANATVGNTGGPSAVATPTDASCGQSNGSVTLAVTNGTSPFTYLWSNNATTQNLPAVPANSYSVTVTDANGCSAIANATVGNTGGPSAVATPTDASCGQSNGSVTLAVTNGTSPFTYLWSNNATTQNLPAVPANSYTVTVTDANGCSAIASATVNNIGGPSAVATPTDASCGQNNGSVTLVVTGGTSPFTYLWSNTSTTQDIPAVPAAAYSVTVTDKNGCSAIASATVNNISGPSAVATPTDAACGQSNGSVSLVVTNGTSPYSYLWSNTATTQNLPAVPATAYSVTVTDKNGCSVTATATVNNTGAQSLSSTQVNTTCGNNNGSVDLTVTGGTSPYTYLWSNTATIQDITAIVAASYTVTVTDANGCIAVKTVSITNTARPALSSTHINTTCGNNNGSVDLTVSGGTLPYNYLWSNTATTQDISSLAVAVYTVTVSDANGCTATTNASVTAIIPPSVSGNSQNTSCGNNNGSINITVTNGTSPFTYLWSNTATTQNISGLASNNYSVIVTDATGCSASASFNVLTSTAVNVTTTPNKIICGQSNGQVSLAVTGGISPYSYLWSNTATTPNLQNVVDGNYTVTVTDSKGCTAIANALITCTAKAPCLLSLNKNTTDASCFSSCNGAIALTINNGGNPVYILWNNGNTTSSLTGLCASNYAVTVWDNNGCRDSLSVAVNQPTELSVNATVTNVQCNNLSNGAINLKATGGTSPYSYLWSNSATTEDPSGLKASTYTVTVTDAHQCTATASQQVNQPNPFVLTFNQSDENCKQGNGSASVTLNGGVPPYNFTWSNNNSTNAITSVGAGVYTLTITDDNGCTINTGVVVKEKLGDTITLSSTANQICSGQSVTVSASGSQNYSWSPATGLNTSTGAIVKIFATADEQYRVTAIDLHGCKDTAYYSLTVHAQASADFKADSITGCSPLTVFFTNNSTNADNYQWVVGNQGSTEQNPVITIDSAGTYSAMLIAINQYGCNDTLKETGIIHVYPDPVASFTSRPDPGTIITLRDATVNFMNQSSNANSYFWDFGDGTYDYLTNPVHQYTNDSVFSVMLIATNQYGCRDTAREEEIIVPNGSAFIPNTFTPNGDGHNDYFRIYGEGIKWVHMKVFDRWGALVFESAAADPYWDGTFFNKPMNTAVFVYIVEIDFMDNTSSTRHGDVTLLR